MKNALIVVALLALIGVGVGLYLYNKPHKDIAHATPDFELASAQLFADFETDEAAAQARYLDKVVEVNGTVREVSAAEEGGLNVILNTESDFAGVICQFNAEQAEAAAGLQTGQEVTIKGVCTGMLMDVVLIRCVLIS